jgi:hypothetical protein
MKRHWIGAVVFALVASLALATSAFASQPQPVTITVTETGPGAEPFDSTGGIICAHGIVSEATRNFVGWPSDKQAQILIVKHFECADGTFDVLLRVSLDFATCDTIATWSVLDGSGAYERLRGAGSLTGVGECESILDVYTGSMHFD